MKVRVTKFDKAVNPSASINNGDIVEVDSINALDSNGMMVFLSRVQFEEVGANNEVKEEVKPQGKETGLRNLIGQDMTKITVEFK